VYILDDDDLTFEVSFKAMLGENTLILRAPGNDEFEMWINLLSKFVDEAHTALRQTTKGKKQADKTKERLKKEMEKARAKAEKVAAMKAGKELPPVSKAVASAAAAASSSSSSSSSSPPPKTASASKTTPTHKKAPAIGAERVAKEMEKAKAKAAKVATLKVQTLSTNPTTKKNMIVPSHRQQRRTPRLRRRTT
jgi:hypothetical protein